MKCQWFFHCQNTADKQVEHPTLGFVDTCDEHIAWLGDGSNPTKFVPPLANKHAIRIREILDEVSPDLG